MSASASAPGPSRAPELAPRALDEVMLATSPPPQGDQERVRVCRDVLSLLTTEELRSSLRREGLPVSGLKQDMVTRLAPSLEDIDGGGRNQRPTTRQLKYVLWLWRHQNLHGRVLMRWDILSRRDATSDFISQWKPQDA